MRKALIMLVCLILLSGCNDSRNEPEQTPGAAVPEATAAWEEPAAPTPGMSAAATPSRPAQPDKA